MEQSIDWKQLEHPQRCKLASVSTYWNNTVSNYAPFWMSISDQESAEWTRHVLSKNTWAPLKVWLYHPPSKPLMNTIKECSPRWKTLWWEIGAEELMRTLGECSTPQLISLAIVQSFFRDSNAIVDIPEQLSRTLRRIFLHRVDLRWDSLMPCHLESLHLTQLVTAPTWDQIYALLQNSPNLEKLGLTNIPISDGIIINEFASSDFGPIPEPLRFPRLWSMKLSHIPNSILYPLLSTVEGCPLEALSLKVPANLLLERPGILSSLVVPSFRSSCHHGINISLRQPEASFRISSDTPYAAEESYIQWRGFSLEITGPNLFNNISLLTHYVQDIPVGTPASLAFDIWVDPAEPPPHVSLPAETLRNWDFLTRISFHRGFNPVEYLRVLSEPQLGVWACPRLTQLDINHVMLPMEFGGFLNPQPPVQVSDELVAVVEELGRRRYGSEQEDGSPVLPLTRLLVPAALEQALPPELARFLPESD